MSFQRFLGSGIVLANAHLTELDLSDNAFGPIAMEGLADFLKSSCCYTLQQFKLNNNGLGITGAKVRKYQSYTRLLRHKTKLV